MKKLTILVTALIVVSILTSAATRSKKSEISRNLDIFNALYKELQTFYVDSIDAEKSIDIAIGAMLNDIDPYTEYIPAKAQESFRSMTTGEYGGIGSYIMERNGNTYISEPYEGSPANLAGLRPGDRIIMIDADSTAGWNSSKVSDKLKGQQGTTVKVTVNRPWVKDSILSFDIVRRKIQIPSVPYRGIVKGDIGYISLSSFTDKSYNEVRDALQDLIKNKGAKSIVLDLRGNGGGLLESAVQILGLFLPKGTPVLTTKGKGALTEKTYKTTVAPVDTKIPLAVLIDGSTASSAEIVSGALQDLDRAVIVGNRSFGKGLVQSTRQLPYDGMLKVTIAKYYIPSGRLIQAIDYSHRNPDGSVARIPDSLTTVWHTRAGREVRDGGGITPDIKSEYPEGNRLVYNIVRDGWSFDFANRYAATHPEGVPAEEFEVTDTIFSEFKKFIDPDKFKYDRACELVIDQLEKSAKTEGYLNDSVQARIDALRSLLQHDLEHDLNLNREMIASYLGPEMVMRWHGTRGSIIQTLKTDQDVDSAANVLHDPARYNAILGKK